MKFEKGDEIFYIPHLGSVPVFGVCIREEVYAADRVIVWAYWNKSSCETYVDKRRVTLIKKAKQKVKRNLPDWF